MYWVSQDQLEYSSCAFATVWNFNVSKLGNRYTAGVLQGRQRMCRVATLQISDSVLISSKNMTKQFSAKRSSNVKTPLLKSLRKSGNDAAGSRLERVFLQARIND